MKNWKDNLQYFPQMRIIGRLAAQCLDEIEPYVKSSVTTAELEEFIIDFQTRHHLKNSQYKFHGFPAFACIGKNDVVCHGVPSKNIMLNNGDIVKIDVTFNLDGFHGDTARTFPVGKPDHDTYQLLLTGKTALNMGIAQSYPGNHLSDIGAAIESYVIGQKFSIIKDFTGHGILRQMHEAPIIRHYWEPAAPETEILPGMTFTIEPIVCAGTPNVRVLSDKWTTVTTDRSWCAQEEHTLGITEDGVEIFTIS